MILFSDGCGEFYDTAHLLGVWDQVSNATVNPTAGRRGGAGIVIGSFSGAIGKGFPLTTGPVFVGFGFHVGTLSNGTEVASLMRNGVEAASLIMQGDGSLTLSCALTDISATGILLPGVFHYIEIQFTNANGVGGSYEVRVDGVTVLLGTGLDTQDSPLPGTDFITFLRDNDNNFDVTIDDVYICNSVGTAPQNTFLGDIRIDPFTMNSDGARTEFNDTFPTSPTTHYTKIDEVPATGDTDYNETPTLNDIDLFGITPIPTIVGGATILGVKVAALSRKLDAGNRTITLVARPIATDHLSPVKAIQTDYHYQTAYFDKNPEISGPWVEATVNASQFGYKATV